MAESLGRHMKFDLTEFFSGHRIAKKFQDGGVSNIERFEFDARLQCFELGRHAVLVDASLNNCPVGLENQLIMGKVACDAHRCVHAVGHAAGGPNTSRGQHGPQTSGVNGCGQK